jgi:predicted nucleic acid-binding protein
LARIEFFSASHRHFREGKITSKNLFSIFNRFREDEEHGYWTWFPIHSRLMEECCAVFETLPQSIYLRSADALHLSCAKAQGFKTIYTNDESMIATAPHYGIKAVNVISKLS